MTEPVTPARGEFSEASMFRPLASHMRRAHEAWEKLAEFARANRPKSGADTTVFDAQLNHLRLAAGTGYWLYPLVEARRGIPR